MGVKTRFVVGIRQVKVSAKKMNAKFIACELFVKGVCTFVVVLYRNQ